MGATPASATVPAVRRRAGKGDRMPAAKPGNPPDSVCGAFLPKVRRSGAPEALRGKRDETGGVHGCGGQGERRAWVYEAMWRVVRPANAAVVTGSRG